MEPALALAAAALVLPPHAEGPPPHAGPASAEWYLLLSGVLAVTIADRTVMLRAGEAVCAPAGAPRSCWNPAAAPALLLLICLPAPA